MKFDIVRLSNKIVEKNFQNCSYRDDEVTNYFFFLKNCAKYDENKAFSKINVVTAKKRFSKSSFVF